MRTSKSRNTHFKPFSATIFRSLLPAGAKAILEESPSIVATLLPDVDRVSFFTDESSYLIALSLYLAFPSS